MLPDFPKVKAHLQSQLLRWVQIQVPVIAPVLGQVKRFQQHEGKDGILSRADKSTAEMKYQSMQFEFALSRDQMRTTDMDALFTQLTALAEHMAKEQSTMLIERVSEAAEGVGNTIDAGGRPFEQRHLLEMFEKVQTDFDPETEKPTGQSFLMHPSLAAKVIPRAKEWEKDPNFVAEYERIMNKQREEWRAREDRRKLVD